MTFYINRHHTRPTVSLSLFAFLLFSAALLNLVGCGNGDGAEGSATLTELVVVPEAAYPDVEVEVSFTIVPASGHEGDDFSWRVEFGDGRAVSGDGLSAEARHRYGRTGQFTITVEALRGSTVAASADIAYSVYDPVDLRIEAVTAQPTNLQVDELLTVSFRVENKTAGPVKTPFILRAYLAESREITRADLPSLPVVGETIRDVNEDGDSIQGGAQVSMGINGPVPDVSSGQYYVVAVIDPDNHIADRDLDDNLAISANPIRVENIDEALPDIAVAALEFSPDRAFPELSRITRSFSLSNLGNQDVFNVVHRTYLQVGSPELGDDAILLHTSDPLTLAGRQERLIGPTDFVLSEPIVPPAGQELEVYLIVQAYSQDGDVQEIRDDNNTAISSPPLLVSDQPVEGPDIAVHHFQVSPAQTYLGGNLQLEATIANEGDRDVSSFLCGIYLGAEPRIRLDGDPRMHNINIPGLEAGQISVISRSITVPGVHQPGQYYFYLFCDPNDALLEPYRGNNYFIQTTPVMITDQADIDLFIDELALPDTAADGDTIPVQARVCVSGSNASGVTKGALYAGPVGSVDFSGEPAQTFEIPNINPGECLDLTLEVEARCQDFNDRFTVGLIVDADEHLPEIFLDNNRRIASTPTTLSGAYCACEEDEFAPNHRPLDAYDLGSESISGALCQPGGCDYFAVQVDQGDSLLVTTSFDSAQGGMATKLLVPSGTQILDESAAADRQEVALFNASSTQRYLVSVCADQGTRNYYELDLNVLPQPQGVDVLPRNLQIPHQDSFSIGATIPIDLRIYNLGLESTGDFQAEVILTTTPDMDDPDQISLSLADVSSINAGSYRDLTLQAKLPTLISDGDYYLAVLLDPDETLNDDNRQNNFAFTRQLTVKTYCYDFFSPNHTIGDAAPIDPGNYSNLVVCADSYDYFELCAPNGHRLSARASFIDDDGDIDIVLYNQNLEVVDSSARSGVDVEEVNVDYVNGDQCYYLRVALVTLADEAENTYSLNFEVNELPPEMQCDADFEPNDDFASATSLWAALNHGQSLDRCPREDEDFYQVRLSPASPVTFRATLDPPLQAGTLRLQLYTPNGTPEINVETAPGIPTAEIENYLPPTAGRYFLQVTVGGNERRVTYRLEAEGLPGVDLAAENLTIGPGTYQEGDDLRLGFILHNYGGSPVTDVAYEVYLGSSPTLNRDDDPLLGAFTVDALGAEQSIEVQAQVMIPTGQSPGTHYLHIFVDPDDALNDVNRNNNRISTPVIIIEPPNSGDDDP